MKWFTFPLTSISQMGQFHPQGVFENAWWHFVDIQDIGI